VGRTVSAPPPRALKPGEVVLGTVDEFEGRRASELATRNGSLPPHQRGSGVLETRQLSHRREGGNRLFDRLDETRRRALLRSELERRPGVAKLVADASREEEVELAQLRRFRSQAGCTCCAADAGTKGLSGKRLRGLLEDRGLSNKGSRAELLARLSEAAATEPLCGATSGPLACPCAAAGVRCHYDVCKCDCDACSNPEGRDDYDRRAVVAHVRTHVKESARLSRDEDGGGGEGGGKGHRRKRSKSMCA